MTIDCLLAAILVNLTRRLSTRKAYLSVIIFLLVHFTDKNMTFSYTLDKLRKWLSERKRKQSDALDDRCAGDMFISCCHFPFKWRPSIKRAVLRIAPPLFLPRADNVRSPRAKTTRLECPLRSKSDRRDRALMTRPSLYKHRLRRLPIMPPIVRFALGVAVVCNKVGRNRGLMAGSTTLIVPIVYGPRCTSSRRSSALLNSASCSNSASRRISVVTAYHAHIRCVPESATLICILNKTNSPDNLKSIKGHLICRFDKRKTCHMRV